MSVPTLLGRLLASRKVQASLAAGLTLLLLRLGVRFGLPLESAEVSELSRELVALTVAYVLATAHEDAGRARAGSESPGG